MVVWKGGGGMSSKLSWILVIVVSVALGAGSVVGIDSLRSDEAPVTTIIERVTPAADGGVVATSPSDLADLFEQVRPSRGPDHDPGLARQRRRHRLRHRHRQAGSRPHEQPRDQRRQPDRRTAGGTAPRRSRASSAPTPATTSPSSRSTCQRTSYSRPASVTQTASASASSSSPSATPSTSRAA